MSRSPAVHVFTTACGASDRVMRNALGLIRSLYAGLRRHPRTLHLHLLHDGGPAAARLAQLVRRALALGLLSPSRLRFSASPTSLPARWRSAFALCSFARLSIAAEFPRLDHAIYIDADAYVLGDIREAFDATFAAFGAAQWAAVALESERGSNYYHSYLRQHPEAAEHVFTPQGLNAGVLMMNLTRLRATDFTSFAFNFSGRMPMGDQDVINSYFARRREEVYLLPCQLNRRPDSNCPDAAWKEPAILHGNREAFVSAPGGNPKTLPFTSPLFLAAGQFYQLDALSKSPGL
ncbi:hypothetical protein AB1Y20_005969 [Prymnesium parvum]|uniref:UDP-D-xylose:beta-D-glucoside alpha-1,3-D-xylosyltransferase n=1 Tax=Prymnesium parvum TaxID=97485 RepID=A0AB34J2K7_PRYPA